MSYHSKYCADKETPSLSGFGFTPLKTSVAGPAPKAADDEEDIIDEALYFFRAMTFFKNF